MTTCHYTCALPPGERLVQLVVSGSLQAGYDPRYNRKVAPVNWITRPPSTRARHEPLQVFNSRSDRDARSVKGVQFVDLEAPGRSGGGVGWIPVCAMSSSSQTLC